MNVVPQILTKPETPPVVMSPPASQVQGDPADKAQRPHETLTMQTIEIRATTMSVVLEKIMTYDGGYAHGGLND